jgi:hypothetical protein
MSMTTIFILNAITSFLATLGIGGYLVRQRRQSRRTRVALLRVRD